MVSPVFRGVTILGRSGPFSLYDDMSTVQKITRAAFLTAVCVVLGYIFIAVPNLEMITAGIFISGVLLGPGYGIIIGCIAETIFSLFNPMGAPLPPVLAAQTVSMALVGLAGGLCSRIFINVDFFKRSNLLKHFLLAFLGITLTLVFDLLTNLSFVYIAGITGKPLFLYLLAGLAFSVFHIASNTLIFTLIVPIIITRLRAWSVS